MGALAECQANLVEATVETDFTSGSVDYVTHIVARFGSLDIEMASLAVLSGLIPCANLSVRYGV